MPAAAARIRSTRVPCGMSSASSSPDSFNSSKRLRCDGCGEAEKAQQTFFTRRNSTRWPVLAFALVWSRAVGDDGEVRGALSNKGSQQVLGQPGAGRSRPP